MDFETVLAEKNYLIKSVMKRLKINSNHDEFYHIGTIALYHALNNYDSSKDKNNNFDVYAYYIILNQLRNELTRQSRYSKLVSTIDLFEHEHLAPIVENELLNSIELEEIFKSLPKNEYKIIKLKKAGYTNHEIAQILNVSDQQLKYMIKLLFKKLKNILSSIDVN